MPVENALLLTVLIIFTIGTFSVFQGFRFDHWHKYGRLYFEWFVKNDHRRNFRDDIASMILMHERNIEKNKELLRRQAEKGLLDSQSWRMVEVNKYLQKQIVALRRELYR